MFQFGQGSVLFVVALVALAFFIPSGDGEVAQLDADRMAATLEAAGAVHVEFVSEAGKADVATLRDPLTGVAFLDVEREYRVDTKQQVLVLRNKTGRETSVEVAEEWVGASTTHHVVDGLRGPSGAIWPVRSLASEEALTLSVDVTGEPIPKRGEVHVRLGGRLWVVSPAD